MHYVKNVSIINVIFKRNVLQERPKRKKKPIERTIEIFYWEQCWPAANVLWHSKMAIDFERVSIFGHSIVCKMLRSICVFLLTTPKKKSQNAELFYSKNWNQFSKMLEFLCIFNIKTHRVKKKNENNFKYEFFKPTRKDRLCCWINSNWFHFYLVHLFCMSNRKSFALRIKQLKTVRSILHMQINRRVRKKQYNCLDITKMKQTRKATSEIGINVWVQTLSFYYELYRCRYRIQWSGNCMHITQIRLSLTCKSKTKSY